MDFSISEENIVGILIVIVLTLVSLFKEGLGQLGCPKVTRNQQCSKDEWWSEQKEKAQT